jgi:hypothetical protein
MSKSPTPNDGAASHDEFEFKCLGFQLKSRSRDPRSFVLVVVIALAALIAAIVIVCRTMP